jgi:hypothetical protein
MKSKILVFFLHALAVANVISPIHGGQTPLIAVEEENSDAFLNASASGDYWLGRISHAGSKSIYDSSYQVYRNVVDFGAKGDGIQDDTNAIQNAISCRSAPDPLRRIYSPGFLYSG